MIESTPASDPKRYERVRNSFARQGAMALLGAAMSELEAGHCTIELPFRE